ncbi:cytochrome c-type biogenesis protein [Glacieibacterium megasporae]|uniref:cytochrome c-type biogenesis protein n=1 Tax=Glacieibacterium megasporae TaxID=2835787 RepID=UPI001C1E2931|nr:cytochrome c-type biogenesis protein [Polymorphobacter megasporae]UAJ11543.1 cytochrome c-type biogenesis protein CcmH [Polymorphobacter megasporae]
MRIAAALVALLIAAPSLAVTPSEQLKDPVLEARARAISAGIRCVVCQNQSIDDSDAPLAHDLRVIVRERLVAGATDAQAVQYLVDRYGSYVLLKPPLEPATIALWFAPLAFVVIGGAGVVYYVRRRSPAATVAPLSAADAAAADALLRQDRI